MITPYRGILNSDVATLPQTLKQSGYKTYYFGVTDSPSLPLDRGIGKGFDQFYDADDPGSWTSALRNTDLSGNKFFAFFHTYDAHDYLSLPEKNNLHTFYTKNTRVSLSRSDQCRRTYGKLIQKYPKAPPLHLGDDPCPPINAFAQTLSVQKGVPLYSVKIEFDVQRREAFQEVLDGIDVKDRKEFIQAVYETSIYELDAGLKLFFEYLRSKDLLKNTMIIITADHGEEFYEHGLWGHVLQPYNESIHVPFILYIPNTKPRRVTTLVQLVDIPPTILGILGLERMQQAMGVDLFSQGARSRSSIYSEIFGDRKQTIISKDWKFILNNDTGSKELYNLKNDPGETINLLSTHTKEARVLEKILRDNLAHRKIYEPTGNQEFPQWLNEDDRKKLLQTGYR